jgi:very-short-patch-repair endonuclease
MISGIPTTTPTRTLVDLAGVVPPDVLEDALDDALRRRLTTLSRMRRKLDELGRQGRPGTAVMRKLLAVQDDGEPIPQSVLETRFMRLLRQSGLPTPRRQYPIRAAGNVFVVDFAWPEAHVAIETDGYRWHSGRARWAQDLARRNALTALGWRVIHVTWADVEARPHDIGETIRTALHGA